MRVLIFILTMLLISCESEEEMRDRLLAEKIAEDARLKSEITERYRKLTAIPASDACLNYTGYRDLKDFETLKGTDYYRTIASNKASQYQVKCEANKRYAKVSSIAKDVFQAFEATEFFSANHLFLDNSYSLSKGGINHRFESRTRSLVYLEMTALDNGISEIGMEVLYPSDYDRPIDAISLFLPKADTSKIATYLKSNLNAVRDSTARAPILKINGGKLQAANVQWSVGNQTVNDYTISIDFDQPVTQLYEKSDLLEKTSEDYRRISKQIQDLIVSNLNSDPSASFLQSKYPYLDNADNGYSPVEKKTIYLFYSGLDSLTFWTKPGALNFGGKPVKEINISKPLEAQVIAHASLPGDRNYFYIVQSDTNQGWVGRPYVKKDKKGKTFYMANPITGEKFQTSLNVSVKNIRQSLSSHPNRFVPSYDSIQWNSDIPVEFRRQGYDMYVEALQDGYDEVERLTRAYNP